VLPAALPLMLAVQDASDREFAQVPLPSEEATPHKG
jgi:hypothetical protein